MKKLFLRLSLVLGFIAFFSNINEPTISVKADEISYEESLELPKADFTQDTLENKSTITAYSTSRPNSISDYKKLGYKNSSKFKSKGLCKIWNYKLAQYNPWVADKGGNRTI